MFAFLTNGIGLGFLAGVSPGPFQAFIISSALTYGWRRSLPIIFTPLIIDWPLIIVTLLALGALQDILPGFIDLIRIGGALLLLWIAWGTFQQVRAGIQMGSKTEEMPGLRQTMIKAMTMNALSPGPYLFWSTVNGPLLLEALQISPLHGLAFLVGFYGTFLLMLAGTLFLFDRAGRLDPRVTRALLSLTIVVLLVFSVQLFTDAIT